MDNKMSIFEDIEPLNIDIALDKVLVQQKKY